MKYIIFLFISAVLKESHPLNPEILKYDQYMKDFETTGRRIKETAKDKEMDGLVMKREDGEWYKKTLNNTQTEFDKFHPDINQLKSKPWPLADNLTKDTLRKVCDEVLADNYPLYYPPGEFPYIDPAESATLETERVIRNAAVVCTQGIKHMRLIYCSYNGTEFYLAEGNNTHVFRMGKDPIDEIYYFQSGAHVIHYNNP